MKLDHLAITCAELETGVAWAEAKLGVTFGPGGRHARFGTHNRLIGMADDLYLEVIAPDPMAKIEGPRWFGLDDPPQTPRLGNWICAVPDLDPFVPQFGEPVALSRDGLTWTMAVPPNGALPDGGGSPTLISWGADVIPPGQSLSPGPLKLEVLEIHHPAARLMCRPINAPCDILWRNRDTVAIKALIRTPKGPLWLE